MQGAMVLKMERMWMCQTSEFTRCKTTAAAAVVWEEQTGRRMVKCERERKRSNSSSLETTLWKSLKKGHQLRISVAVEASSSGRSGFEDVVGSGSGIGARERRRHKMREERKRRQDEEAGKYPEWATILENACKDDAELRDIIGDALGDPEEMKRRVEERVRRKGRDILQPKTGSAIPMAVSFRDFDPTDSYIWLELYSAPSEKDIEIIGSVVRSWYVLGRLGGFNSMNMQLTQLPLNAKLSYSPEKAEEALPSVFHNIGDVEFQEHWARVWVDLGTSDPVALDVIINSFAAVSSENLGHRLCTVVCLKFGQIIIYFSAPYPLLEADDVSG